MSLGGLCNGADFTEISKILGKLSMGKQRVLYPVLFSTHAQEPGNEADYKVARSGSL